MGEVIPQELVRELEHVGRSEDGLPVLVEYGLVAQAEPVAADDFLGLGIPQDQLFVSVGRVGVELVYIQGLPGAAAVVTEGNFPEPADFPDDVHGLGSHHVEFIAGAVGGAQQGFRGKLGL